LESHVLWLKSALRLEWRDGQGQEEAEQRASLLEMARVWQHLADEQGRATNVQQQQAAIAVT
jgi:NAD-dependent oxidoreductase involved in siderophore biosynthesis